MSSPIALQKKNIAQRLFVDLHQRFSHNNRVNILSQKLSGLIDKHFPDAETIECLDVGCGDMKIPTTINKLNPKTSWSGIDLYELPASMKGSKMWSRYKKYDGSHFPFDSKSMDVVLFCDVLHHAKKGALLLKEAARVGRIIIIKDHFEYSAYSRIMLKAMDFIGNWGYGVTLPDKYFNVTEFKNLCVSSGLLVSTIDVGIDLYAHLPVIRYFLKSQWQFVAVLES